MNVEIDLSATLLYIAVLVLLFWGEPDAWDKLRQLGTECRVTNN